MIRQEPVQPAEDRRSRVLSAALEEFVRYGYEGASTNRIALRAGVAKGLVFHYFGNKEGLYQAALDEAWPSVFSGWDRPLPEDPFDRLQVAVMARLSRLEKSPLHARLVADVVGQRRALSLTLRLRVQRAYQALRASFKEGATTASFRTDVPPELGLDLLALVAEALERRYVQALARPTDTGSDPLTAIRQEVEVYVDVLRRGIYRPDLRGTVAAGRAGIHHGPAHHPGASRERQPIDARRDRILQAAQDLFGARGYDGTTADAISARAGVAKGLVFHHFGTKAGLYLAAVEKATEQIVASFFQDVTPPPADLFQRVSAWSLRKLQTLEQHADLYHLVLDAVTRPPETARAPLDEYVQQAMTENWIVLLKDIDTAPFREEVPPSRALALVMLVMDTFADQHLEEVAGNADPGFRRLEELLQEANAYLALLRDGLGRFNP